MRRRSRPSGKPAKTRRRKTATPKAARRREASVAGPGETVALLKRERDEALEQLSAASEVLKVISSSPGDLKPVFEAMLANATRICEASFGLLQLHEGGAFRLDESSRYVMHRAGARTAR